MNSMQTKERIDKKILILFIISFLGLVLSLSFSLTLINDYHLNNPEVAQSYTFAHGMTFFTHLSLILVTIGSLLEVVNKGFELGGKLNFLRLTTVSGISLTGLIYFIPGIGLLFRDFAVILTNFELTGGSELNRGSPELYAFLDLVQTTLLHVIIPILSIYILIKNSKLNGRIEKMDALKMISVSMISISVYCLYVNILILFFHVEEPYIFFNGYGVNDGGMIIIMISSILAIGAAFFSINVFFVGIQNKYSV